MNNIHTKRIVWMMDETIANTHPRNWHTVRQLEAELVATIGNKSFQHEIVDPIPCLRDVAGLLDGRTFSSVIDLTGWMKPALEEMFPQIPIESDFSLSRVRVISSPRLETTGYRISMSPHEIEERKKELDLSHPLIVDDASFSGWTSRKTMEIWGIPPEQTTHAFLIANTGNLGSELGAVSMLESLGSTVVFGTEITTPHDDGWHLKDLHQHPQLDQAFILSLLFQEAAQRNGFDSDLVQQFFTHETVTQTVFPEHFSSEKIRQLTDAGRFILRNGNVVHGDEVHAKNPFLWASPYFQEHVDIGQMVSKKDKIVSILKELKTMTTDPEGKHEASLELQREVRRMRFHFLEGQSGGGKERL